MTTASPSAPVSVPQHSTATLTRILEEGYGAGAWHGPDLAAALADIGPEVAFRRPAAGRHNIAEIALHHAWYIRSVTARLTGQPSGPFPLEGDDWFEVSSGTVLAPDAIRSLVAGHQQKLVQAVGDIGAGRIASPLTDTEQFNLVLGITCHAVYHAGQIQLVKRLNAG